MRRVVLLAGVASLLCAAGLAFVNLLVGPAVCVQPAVCTPPLPGQTGCGPVPQVCQGAAVPVDVLVALSLGVGLAVGTVLALRRHR